MDRPAAWNAMNGNAIYNLQDPAFLTFVDKVLTKYPKVPYDVAIKIYMDDIANFADSKVALTKIMYTNYVHNYGGTPFHLDQVAAESPHTYMVHSACRAELPNPQTYCWVCPSDEEWSDTCQIKLNSFDAKKGYNRFTTGPTYKGIDISNSNYKALAAAGVAI